MLLSTFTSILALGVFVNGADHTVDKAHRSLQGIGNFASVGQDLVGVASSNEEGVLFGTTVALSSGAGGTRLAVGAPMHDYNSTDGDELAIVDNGGGVFLYDFNGVDWDLLWFLAGEAGEGLGERLSLSADGATVAVRRESANPDATEVYSVSDDGTAELLGQPVTCGANGDTVTLAADGLRMAVSCENFAANTGLVEIFDFVAGSWVTTGSLGGSVAGDFFGWSTAFSNDGNRIAVSAPNYDGPNNDVLEKCGLVRVFDYINGVWTQVGDDLVGSNSLDQLGFAMDLSGDGLSLVTGAPRADDGVVAGSGLVQVFSESFGLWSQVSDPIAGAEEGDRFGRSVSISDDGSRIIASSFIHDGSRGHLRIFDLEGGSWTQYGSDIDGDNRADRFGFGRFSVSMTGDGSRVASGSTGFDDVGRVRVFESDELVLTSIPTSVPTAAPTFEATADPTLLPTLEPTEAGTDYTVTACQCNQSFECDPEIIVTPEVGALICLETNAVGVEIESIRQLDFAQQDSSFSQNGVNNGEEDDMTVVALMGTKAVVRTSLFEDFFDGLGPVDATGVCTLLVVVDNAPVRRLNAPVTNYRGINDNNARGLEAVNSDFAVKLLLQDDSEGGLGSSGASQTMTMVNFVLATVAYGVAAIM